MPLNILIVDDTIVYRQILSEVIAGFYDVTSDTAPNGVLALKYLEQHPVNLVLLDVQMPVMDGLETLRHINKQYPEITVVMISGCSKEVAHITMQALRMGALEFIRKPEGCSREDNKQQIYRELKSVITLVRTRMSHPPKTAAPAINKTPAVQPPAVLTRKQPRSFGIVVIGVSTGGPNALTTLVKGLSASFPLPILTVQHMPPNFTAALAEDLNRKSDLTVCEASEGMPITPGTMIIARGGYHMVTRLTNGTPVIGINNEPPENSCKPAVDVLFRSVAHCYGTKGVLALIMTGMGSDGLAGVRTLKRKECYCLTQSEESCVVYGMPRAINLKGLSDESTDLNQLAERLTTLTQQIT